MDNEPKDPAILAKEEADAKAKADSEAKQAVLDAELKAKEEKKANLDKAILEAEEDLRAKRKAKTDGEPAPNPADPPKDVQIDMNDPGAKAWDKHIKDQVQPLAQDMEKEKAEVRGFALRKFLEDKPALASDPVKVKELVELYDRIKTASERTQEGVLFDLGRAFGAIYHEQLINAAKTQKFDKVKEMQLFTDPAVDKGATGYATEEERMPNLSADDMKQLQAWGMTPQQWWDMKRGKTAA